MTVITQSPSSPPDVVRHDVQRFVFHHVDWAFYQSIGQRLADERAFLTYYKGRLEIVTVSLLHERAASLLTLMICVLAEETDTPLLGAGMATLHRMDLDEGVEPDSGFYTAHEARMRGKERIDLSIDPPPDLAIEVEVTRRLGVRKSIYRELGVPEVWVYNEKGLEILLRQENDYRAVDRSPTFPWLSPEEMFGFVIKGLSQNQTEWTKSLRRRVRELVAASKHQGS